MTSIVSLHPEQATKADGALPDRARRLTSNRLPVLAEKIRSAHKAAQGAWATTVDRSREAGQGLIEAKGLLSHGQWLSWLEEIGIEPRMAQLYMQIARLPQDKYDTVSHLGFRGVLELIAGLDADLVAGLAAETTVLDSTATRAQPRRRGPDFWTTPTCLTAALVRHVVPELPPGPIWECAAGDGRLARAIGDATGRTVIETDLYPQNGSQPHDFLHSAVPGPAIGSIAVTNPPFNNNDEFLARGLALLDAQQISGLVLLLRHDHLMSASRTEVLNRAVREVHCNWRPIWIAGTRGNPRWSFHWIQWGDGPRQAPLYLTEADIAAERRT